MITTLITVPDHVYAFYQKAARETDGITAQELMSRALAASVDASAEPTLKQDSNDSKI